MFTVEQFKKIARIIEKANPRAGTRLDSLRSELSDLLIAVGVVDDGTEHGRQFRELAAEDTDHSELARRFRKIANAGNPLRPSLYIRNMMSEVYFALRGSPKEGGAATSGQAIPRMPDLLTQWSVPQIQGAARNLAIYHQSRVVRGPRTKHHLDTLLDQLADIYANITGYTKHRHCLSLSERSLFGKFCRSALEPHCEASESSFAALGRRWERIKRHASRPAEHVRKAPKRRLRPRKKQDPTAT